MDPLENLEEDVWRMVFQHFSVRDIIKASLVSPMWNNLIGGSRTCMSKVWLRFYWPTNNVDSLMSSKRKYQNYKVQRGFLPSLIPVFEKYKWVRVMMRDDREMDPDNYIGLMQDLAPTLEELELWNVSVVPKDASKDFDPIDFPVLRQLEWNNTSCQCLKIFLGSNPRLHCIKSDASNIRLNTSTSIESNNILKGIINMEV